MWDHYQCNPSFVLGFHGCDESVGEKVLRTQNEHLTPSNNKWDWLGPGIYFWESSPARAMQFCGEAVDKKFLTNGAIKKPFVIGAVIDLGLCLNLFDSAALNELRVAYKRLAAAFKGSGTDMPKNQGKDRAARYRDTLVINALHESRIREGYEPYSTVRGGFPEGRPAYPGAGFSEKAHIQIAVRDPKFIKSYFRPFTINNSENNSK